LEREGYHRHPPLDRRLPSQENGAPAPLDGRLRPVTARSATPEVRSIPIDSIRIPAPRLRSLGDVEALRESISSAGLLQPIILDGGLTLVCGLHRLEACRQLGWDEIPAMIERMDGPAAELAEIDENLCRRELSVLERAEHIAKRKRLWSELEAARVALLPPPAEGDKKSKKKKDEKPREAPLTAFVDDTAKRTGRAKRAVREELEIGELPEDVRDSVRETPISHNKRELLALTKMDEPEARAAAVAVKNGEAKSVRKKAPKKDRASEPPPLDGATGEHEVAPLEAPSDDTGGFDAWASPDGSMARERARHAIVDAVDSAITSLEKAESLWPTDEEPAAAEGSKHLRDALASATRLRRWLEDARESTPWAATG
jgi:ParB-like chromosome segregation protein Spo0J